MPSFPIKILRVAERSMEPAIKEGSYVIVWRWASRFNEGDIVVLRHPAKDMWIVKRIKSVDNGMAYVLGDNAAESEDSRKFGSVDAKMILGKVAFAI